MMNTDASINSNEQLYDKGLREDNAYQYINGHFLADRVVMPVIKSLIEQLNINETAFNSQTMQR